MSAYCRRLGFTLIELLIVVAIIAILAAIAVPNFLEAQTRSKVSRVRADQRTVATALEAYAVDNNKYPEIMSAAIGGYNATVSLSRLTSPVAFLSSIDAVLDPFNVGLTSSNPGTQRGVPMGYINYQDFIEFMNWPANSIPEFSAWELYSFGPDRNMEGYTPNFPTVVANGWMGWQTDPNYIGIPYDPTNGTVSSGDLVRVGGAMPAVAVQWLQGGK